MKKQTKNFLNKVEDKDNIEGITTPHIYMGSDSNPKAAIHIEDLDGLNSVNILYQGSPKKWISIPANQAKYFEKRVAHAIGQSLDETIHMLRHKHLYMPKKFFEENQQLHYKEFLQHPGDMVIG